MLLEARDDLFGVFLHWWPLCGGLEVAQHLLWVPLACFQRVLGAQVSPGSPPGFLRPGLGRPVFPPVTVALGAPSGRACRARLFYPLQPFVSSACHGAPGLPRRGLRV